MIKMKVEAYHMFAIGMEEALGKYIIVDSYIVFNLTEDNITNVAALEEMGYVFIEVLD